MIIDFHTHIFSPGIIQRRSDLLQHEPIFGTLYANPKAKMSSTSDLITSMDENNIDISVMQNVQWSSATLCKESNDYIIESAASFPKRLFGFGMIKLDEPETAIPEIERCVANGIKGVGEIRLSTESLNDLEILRPAIEIIIEKGLILLIHASEPVGHVYPGKGDTAPGSLYLLIEAFPDLKLVCAHWGGGLPFYALMPEVNQALKNVYFDSAASPFLYEPRIYLNVVNLAGADKILFGSDYPLLKLSRLIQEIEAADLTIETKNQILAGNAKKLLDINL
jgi:predicted TIM-barrel fold metal-dependent hydrolase